MILDEIGVNFWANKMNKLIIKLIFCTIIILVSSSTALSFPAKVSQNNRISHHQSDYVRDLSILQTLARQENDQAEFALGVVYEYGIGVVADIKHAEDWYTKAAGRGHIKAQSKLANLYAAGNKLRKDYQQAVYWWSKAAEQGDALSQYHLGFAYQHGKGRLLKDYKQAAYWYQKSAEQGDADAQTKLGLAYYLGKGVSRDYRKAADWYKKSAAQNNYNAQYMLGLSLCEGRGVQKNLNQCARLIRQAHENGDRGASKVWERYELWEYQ